MSDENKTLQQTLTQVVGEQETANKDNKGSETDEGMSQQEASDETKTGDTPEYASGIDISDIPEQERPKFKEKFALKAKLLEDGYNVKFQEVAKFKKAQDDLVKMGLSVDEAYDVLAKHAEAKRNPATTTDQKKQVVKTLDKLIEQSPYEQRGALEQMRQIILEETEVTKLREEVAQMRNILGEVAGETINSKRSKVEQYLENQSSEYGKELVDKYKEEFLNAHLKYKIPLERLIQSVVPLDELKQAILLKGRKPLTPEKKNAISSSGSGVSSAGEKIDTKNESFSSLISKISKMK